MGPLRNGRVNRPSSLPSALSLSQPRTPFCPFKAIKHLEEGLQLILRERLFRRRVQRDHPIQERLGVLGRGPVQAALDHEAVAQCPEAFGGGRGGAAQGQRLQGLQEGRCAEKRGAAVRSQKTKEASGRGPSAGGGNGSCLLALQRAAT